jgi:hypothetical protein
MSRMGKVFRAMLLAAAVHGWTAAPARADLCDSVQGGAGTTPSQATQRDVSLFGTVFRDTTLAGDGTWNQVVVQCNRQRDSKGNEVAAITQSTSDNAGKKQLGSSNLEPRVVRGHFNFFGEWAFRQKYVYVLSKSAGKWTMIIPYKAQINQPTGGVIDLGMGQHSVGPSGTLGPTSGDGHAWRLFEGSQVTTTGGITTLIAGARPIAQTRCSTTTFFPGQEHAYDGENGGNAYKRDRENKSIQLGKIQYRRKNDPSELLFEGCRVPEYTQVYWAPPIPWSTTTGAGTTGTGTATGLVNATAKEFVLQNFQYIAETFWTQPGVFELKLLLRGRNDSDFPKATLALLRDDDYLTANFGTQFEANLREMYKSNPVAFNNFSTMTEDTTFQHEVGHAFGLDDEYGKSKDKLNDCSNAGYSGFHPHDYKMCSEAADRPRSIYFYLATSRYVTKQSECQTDPDCDKTEYCDAGPDLEKNVCLPLEADGAACALVGGGHQCKSGQCGLGRCYTAGAVAMGGTCYVDAACSAGHCSSMAGHGGTCVCSTDADCKSTSLY